MKKHLPWILLLIFAAWVASTLRPKANLTAFDTQAFGRLPVLLNGRIQPFDSVARNALLQIRGKQSVVVEGRRQLPAIDWAIELMCKPEQGDTRKVFRIDHPELLALLKLSNNEKFFSFGELRPNLPEFDKQVQRVSGIESAARNPFEKQVMKLQNALGVYHRMKHSLRPEMDGSFAKQLEEYQRSIAPGVEALRAREAGKPFDQPAFERFIGLLQQYDFMARWAYPLIVPPLRPEQSRDDWSNAGVSLMSMARGAALSPSMVMYARMSDAYRENQPEVFNQTVREYRALLQDKTGVEVKKAGWEFLFNHFQPFYKATVLYVVAFVLACLFWFNWSHWLRSSAQYLLVLACLLHTFGMVFRMVLEGRPPVTNLYSSAVFIGWGAVVLGLLLERFYRDGIGIVTAAAVGFITQIIAHNLAVGGDTMEMMRAVLDSNFWLATHVVTITLGYSATFVAGFLAIIFILRGVFTRTLAAGTSKALARMVYGIICFATLFSFAGTVLGGIWADQSWGRFWGWDPKENGALIIVLWNAIILHARWGGLVRERGLMNLAIFGNIVTGFSWFGVNMLGIGLHAYGFMDAAFRWLMIFNVSQLILIAIGSLPLRYWLSFRNLVPSGSAAPSATAPQRKTVSAEA